MKPNHMDFADILKPYEECLPNKQWLYDDGTSGVNYIKQDGWIYAWSESFCAYQFAWYLYSDSEFAKKVKLERPIADGWLT